jgi:hypothetical protein
VIKEGFKDCIHTNVQVYLGWKDRLKVLLGKTLHVDVRIHTEKIPGRCQSESHVWTERLIPERIKEVPQATSVLRRDRDDASPKRIAAQDGRRFG